MSSHPKWKYHATEASRIVETVEQEGDLPNGWFDTPAEALALAEVQAKAKAAEDEAIEAAKKAVEAEEARLKAIRDAGQTDEEKAAAAADAEAYRQELLAKAKGLGLTVHHLTGAEKILAAIAAHDADQSA